MLPGARTAHRLTGCLQMLFVFILCGLASALSNRSVDALITTISRDFSVSVATAALISSIYAFPYALGQPILGPLGDFYGKSRILIACLWILTISVVGCILAPTFDMLLGFRLVGGVAAGGIMPVTMAMMGDRYPPAQRQLAIGRFLIAGLSGMVFGSSLAGIMAVSFGWRSYMWIAGAVAFSAAVAATMTLRQSAASPKQAGHIKFSDARASYARVFSNPKAVLCFSTVLLEGLSFYGVTPYIAELTETGNIGTAREAGFMLGSFGIGGICYSIVLPFVLRNMRRRTMMACGGVLGTAGLWGLMLTLSWPVSACLFAVSGFGFFLLHNCIQAEVAELSADSRSLAFALHSCAFFTGAAVGPVLVGFGLHYIGRHVLIANVLIFAFTGFFASRMFARFSTGSGRM
jgi:predicted MFS family arabinose efflux permease